MKKILLTLSAVCVTASSSLLVTSCGINLDPFAYLPSKTSINYQDFVRNEIKPVAFNFQDDSEGKMEIDFSPILIFTLKQGSGSFLGDPKYHSVASQLVNEYEYFNWFNQTPETLPTIDYHLTPSDLNLPMVYTEKTKVDGEEKEETFPMAQVVRVVNYQSEPQGNGDELEFKVTLKKWKFVEKENKKGIYQDTNQTLSLTIFVNDLSLKELKENKDSKYLEVIN